MKAGILFLIPTLLSDDNRDVIPEETRKVIASLDYFIVENEKSARHFLKAAGYPKPLQQVQMSVLDEHTRAADVPGMLKPLLQGINAGLVSEAGCPAVADPGSNLVALAHDKNIDIRPLVGPSSLLLALMGSGMNGQQFAFAGYLPREGGSRIKAIKELERIALTKNQTQIFIEAPYRNVQVLEAILQTCSDKTLLCIACDLTSKTEFVKTKTVEQWKKTKPDIQKKPVVLIIGK